MSDRTLDGSQLKAVAVDVDERQIVTAGPGSGKTEVVAELVVRLLSEADLDPVDDLLIISFSNAAVHAVERRLRDLDLPSVSTQTLDSLAAELLRDAGQQPENLSFEQRISRGVAYLEKEPWERLSRLSHLIVDEVQDIVGLRADFLLALIRGLDPGAGFTLLGDLAQGIYDFQLRADGDGIEPASFTTAADMLVAVAHIPGVNQRKLTGQHRAVTRDARGAMELRDAALTIADHGRIDEFVGRLVSAGTVQEAARQSGRWAGATAFLTSTNGQALIVADSISQAGCAVELRRSAQERAIDSWVALLLADHPHRSLRLDDFERLAHERAPELDARLLWRALRSLADGRSPDVEISQVRRRLASPRPLAPEFNAHSADNRIVVSTIHRAKGLEFDNVVLVDFPSGDWKDAPDPAEFARTRFVAISRARSLLMRASGPNDSLLKTAGSGDGRRRWFRRTYKGGVTGMEIRLGDVDLTVPGGLDLHETQRLLRDTAKAGDGLTMTLDPRESTLDHPVYDVIHGDTRIGRTAPQFGTALARQRFRRSDRPGAAWPLLSGARLESVVTALGPTPTEVSPHGLWLAPVVTGMLKLDWKGM